MLTSVAGRTSRAGSSLLEMLVTLLLGAVVIAGVGAVGFRQQRFQRDVVSVVERMEQLEQASALVPVSIRAIAPGENDIPPGGARDTSLEFRAMITTAVVCDSSRGSIVLAPTTSDAPHLASVLARPEAGDTAWFLTLNGIVEAWVPRAIGAVIDSTAICAPEGVSPWPERLARRSLVLRVAAPFVAGPWSPVRVTRPWRYSIYRSSDGGWYLGAREWSAVAGRFNTIQPVSGPFRSAATGGLLFQYFDTLGAPIAPGAADTRGISLIQVGFRVDTALPGRFAHAITVTGQSVAAIALRNRAR